MTILLSTLLFLSRTRYDLTAFETGFSQKKSKLIFDFVIFYVLIVDVRYILDNCSRSQRLSLKFFQFTDFVLYSHQALLWTGPISFLVNYTLLCLVCFIGRYFDFVIRFCYFNTDINCLM